MLKKILLLFIFAMISLPVAGVEKAELKLTDEIIQARQKINHEQILKAGLDKWVRENNIENVQECLNAGQRPKTANYGYYDTLGLAIKNNNPEIVKLLLDNGAEFVYYGNDNFDDAIVNNKHKSALVMVTHKNFPEKLLMQDSYPRNAIYYDMPDVLEELLKKGWNPDYSDSLIYAIAYNKYKCAEMLLKYGADPNRLSLEDNSSYKKYIPIIHDLSRIALNILYISAESKPVTPLFYAIHKGDLAYVMLLAKYNADLNLALRNTSPVNYALKRKQYQIAEYMINEGAKPNLKSLELINKTKGNDELKALIREKVNE